MVARVDRGEDGAVLIVVLWTIAAISLVVAGALSFDNASASLARAEQRRLAGEANLRGAVEAAAWSELRADPGARVVADGRAVHLTINGGVVEVRIRDVAGLLDVNRADIALLRSLFEATATSRSAADAAADAIAAARGDVAARGDGSDAAIASVDNADSQEVDPQRQFVSIADVVPLLGGDAGLLLHALPLLTVYGHTGRIDAGLAPAALLSAVPGISREEVQSLLGGRANGILVSDDANAIAAKYAGKLEAGPTDIYRIEVADGPSHDSAVILLMRGGPVPYHVLAWSEAA